jgi:hypothetical protein
MYFLMTFCRLSPGCLSNNLRYKSACKYQLSLSPQYQFAFGHKSTPYKCRGPLPPPAKQKKCQYVPGSLTAPGGPSYLPTTWVVDVPGIAPGSGSCPVRRLLPSKLFHARCRAVHLPGEVTLIIPNLTTRLSSMRITYTRFPGLPGTKFFNCQRQLFPKSIF